LVFNRRAALRGIPQPTVDRGEIPVTDLELMIDIVFGVLWHRLLINHLLLNETLARELAPVDPNRQQS
jgi:hypothetical protein